ncbi:sporulation integral membrane protein YtvI [Clostridium malenominatum]|uniref:Sporulation integral membrane protein YtvI n=1 Tax=Clostridium malenominatum TaxID=1539 RepID=A0ABP3UC68_9CLOT
MDKLIEKLDKYIIFFVLYTLSFILFFKFIKYALPFFLAFIFSLILKGPTEYIIKKFKFKKGFASLITTLAFFAIIITSIWLMTTSLSREAIQLAKNSQHYFSDSANDIYKFIESLKVYYNNLDPSIITSLESNLTSYLSKASNLTVTITSKIIQIMVSFLAYIPYAFMLILFTLLSTYFFTKDFTSTRDKVMNSIIPDKSNKFYTIMNESKRMLSNYALSYLLVILLSFIETFAGFLFLKVRYALTLSIIAAIFDILPILGIGGIYIPLALLNIFIFKNYYIGFGVLIWYVVVTIIRQIVEPKIVSSSLGVHPVSILASIYIGLKVAGIKGMFFCIFLNIFLKVLKEVKVL